MPDEFVDDDGYLSSDFTFTEGVPDEVPVRPQALWIGVRPGFGEAGERLAEPTIWVQYQERYMNSPLTGLVALSPESWEAVNKAVQWRVAVWRGINAPQNVPAADPGTDHLRDTGDTDRASQYAQPELPFPGRDSHD